MKIHARVNWADGWIGFYWDKDRRTLYICPLPFIVFSFAFGGGSLPPFMIPPDHQVIQLTHAPKVRRQKYMIHGERVTSKNDGDVHYVGAQQLVRLYGLDPRECILNSDKTPLRGYDLDDFIHLFPRYEGDYDQFRSFIERKPDRFV